MKKCLILAILLLSLHAVYADTTVFTNENFAYGANAGWMNCRGDVDNGLAVQMHCCSGFVYGANIGWINCGDGTPVNDYQYSNASATDFGVNISSNGDLSGYAYGANVGWINFAANGTPHIDRKTGAMSGYAYGANIGWISLSNTYAYVRSTLAQEITNFIPASGSAYLTTNTVALGAVTTSDEPVSFTVVSGPGSLSGGSNLTFTGAGSVVLRASQSGTEVFRAANPLTNSFTISLTPQNLTFTPASPQTYGTTNALSISGTFGTGTITYSVLSGPGQIVGGTNLTVISGAGFITARAQIAADAMYDATAATAQVVKAAASQTISFTVLPTQDIANSVGLSGTASSGLDLSYTVSAGPGVISDSTNLTFTSTGSVTVVASQPGDINWNAAAPQQQSITVTSAAPPGIAQCTILPELVRTNTPKWRVKSETEWHNSGENSSELPAGTYDVEFSTVTGWTAPAGVSVVIYSGSSTAITGSYVKVVEQVPNDFDGDGVSDLGFYYPPSGEWYIRLSSTETFLQTNFGGGDTTLPVTGFFDSDKHCDYGTYYPATGFWQINKTTEGYWSTHFGYLDTEPVSGDFDGDGITDFGCYYPPNGFWYVYKSTIQDLWTTQFGYSHTDPVTGDFDGDGITDFGCYFAPDGWWYIYKSASAALWTTQFGYADTIPITGDFDGDGFTDFGCYYAPQGWWYIYKSSEGFWVTQFGYANTLPITGDYDGDRLTDFGCYHPDTGYWYVYLSSSKQVWVTQFGYPGTLPIGE